MAAAQAGAGPGEPALHNGTERGAQRYAAPQHEPYAPAAAPAPGGKPRQRLFPGAAPAAGPTPTLNSLLQGGAPARAPAPPAPYPPPGYEPPGWGRAPYCPQPYAQPYRNSTPPSGGRGPGPGYGGYPGAAPGPPAQQPPAGYGPAGYQRYAPPGAPGPPRPPYAPHQGYERGGSPQPPHSPGGAGGQPPGALSPSHDPHHPAAHPAPHPHQGYPPPRPAQPSTPNAHDPESDLTGQNSNDSSGGSGGAGARATTPHLRPTPSPTGSSGSRSMSPAVGQQSVPMPPRPSSSQSDGSGPTSRPAPAPAAAPPAAAPPQHPPNMAAQPYPPHHAYKPPHYPPQHPYPYPPRNHHPYPYPGYRPPPPPQHYLKQPHLGHKHMGPPAPQHHGDGAMPPPTPPDAPHAPDNGPAPSVTALVTTGPDGAPLDEGSQQSTLSNASAASGEETACTTPKPRKDGAYSGAAPSPGAGSHSSAHEDYDASPSSWPRPPSSPVFNSHVPQEAYRSKKSDSLGKLYEMDDSPERRGWVERLLAFMEERRTPIAACPTISKQPLDLYRLYLLVRERGGFVEVTKNKTWKDIAGLLGIGASSSAAYTLRKHYTKNLLAYECHFDRGGIDPQPIINQVEASTKKKNNKANSSPSPGTSNTQESFSGPGTAAPGAPMDNYGGQYGAYPPQQNQQQGYQQGYGYEYQSPYPSSRPVYPPYGPEGDRGYGGGGNEAYRYGGGYGGRYPAPGAPPPAGTPPPPGQPYPDYYRPQHPPPPSAAPNQPPQHESPSPSVNIMNSQLARQLVAPLSPGTKPYHHYGGVKGQMPPPAAGGQPRRHPDFAAKEGAAYGSPSAAPGPTPPRPGPPQQYGQWAGPPGAAGQFPRAPSSPAPPPGAPWRPPPNSQPPQQWPPSPYQPPGQPGAWPAGASGPGAAPGPPRPGVPGAPPRAQAPSPAVPYLRPDGKPYPNQVQPPPGACGVSSLPASQVKRELIFPPDTVEATVPLTEKRRRLTRADVAPVDAWRIMMALKSGLLAETCWALDILNILLFDDNCISYFGLQHMPGLLDLLLEHFQKSLSDVFEGPQVEEEPWFAAAAKSEPEKEAVQEKPFPDPEDRLSLLSGENYTLESRRGRTVMYKTKDDDLFAPDPGSSDTDKFEDAALESWQFGGDTSFSNHVMPCFQGEFVHIPFTRVIESGRAHVRPVCAPEDEGKAERTESASERSADPSPRVKLEEETKEETQEQTNGGEDCDNLEAEPMELERDPEEVERKPVLQIRDPAGTLKRRRLSDYEDECYTRDEPSLNLVTESRDALAKRCIALSNILRGLTFVPGNETEFSRNSGFLALAGKLLLLHHEHAPRAARAKAYERAARDDTDADTCCSSLYGASWWWWDTLAQLRSDALVCCANIAGSVELANQPEAVARPLLDGLLHWCVCPAAAAEDAPPHASPTSPLSPRRLALEALCKLCVTDANVDLVLATPPRSRVRALCSVLAKNLCRQEEQVLREFSVNLLHYLASAESGAAREVALQAPAVGQLVAFIERAEQAALGVANQHGVGALRDNPDAMGTSLDMLRRAASTLLRLAEHPHNRPLFLQQERRLLSLVMSQILDQKVAQELSKVLYQCSRPAHSPRHQDPA